MHPLFTKTQGTFDVFISYASKDEKEIVEPLVAAMKKRNIKVWRDREQISWGDSVEKKIGEGLRKSRYVVVVLSRDYIQSRWAMEEYRTVVNEQISSGSVRILPLLHGTENDVPIIFDSVQFLRDRRFERWTGNPEPVITALLTRLE